MTNKVIMHEYDGKTAEVKLTTLHTNVDAAMEEAARRWNKPALEWGDTNFGYSSLPQEKTEYGDEPVIEDQDWFEVNGYDEATHEEREITDEDHE